MEHRWSVQYGEKRLGDTKGYAVVKGRERRSFDLKSQAIAEAQRLNGWQVDGNERNYASQAAQADRERRGAA
jgi:hypothetical protein